MKSLRPLLFVVLIGGALAAQERVAKPQADAVKTPLRVEDLYLLDAPKTPVLFSDGKRALYVRNWIDAKTKQERNSLWIVEGDKSKTKPLDSRERDARAPVISPDGKWIAFLSTRKPPKGAKPLPPTPTFSDPATDIWIMPAQENASAVPLAGADKPYGRVFNDGFYGRVAFSPDGKKLVFVADDGADPRTPTEKANGVQVVRPDQGEGYTGYGAAQVWVAELDEEALRSLTLPARQGIASKITRLTDDDVWYGDPQWSPDGKTIAVHANKTKDRESVRFSINRNFDIYTIDVATKKQTQLTKGPGPEVSPRWSPDGKRIACLSVPRKGSHRDVFNLALVSLDTPLPHMEIALNAHGASEKPISSPAFPLPDDPWLDGNRLLFQAEVGTATLRLQFDFKEGRTLPTRDTSFPNSLISLPNRLAREGAMRKLLPESNRFLEARLQPEARLILIRWDNGEGERIEGILTLPPKEVAQPPYKLVLHPHGGPHSRTALGFDFTVQVLAAHGYAVFQPNFRGSHGYGQKFIDADRGDFGGGDMRDILTGIDHLVKEGIADPKRQFVYGTSYGGFMTTWLVGHTKQFRAAVAQNAVTDLGMMWGLSDIPSWVEWEFGGRPWEIADKLKKHSPITYVDQVQTPTLILHSRDDRRCPLPMGKAYYQALAARGVPTEMVIYPDEGHGIKQPVHREDVLRRVLAWFAK